MAESAEVPQPAPPTQEQINAWVIQNQQAQNQALAGIQRHLSGLAERVQTPQPQAQAPRPIPQSEQEAENRRFLDRFVEEPYRAVAPVVNAIVEQRMGEYDQKARAAQEMREQQEYFRDYERRVMTANPDLVGYEPLIAAHITRTDPSMSHQDRTQIALEQTRAQLAQEAARRMEGARREEAQRKGQYMPPAPGFSAEPGQPAPIDELEARRQRFDLMNRMDRRKAAAK